MYRDPESPHPMLRAWPSDRAKAARDKWIADNGGEEAVKRRIAVGGGPSTADLEHLVDKWRIAMLTRGLDHMRSGIDNERLRKLRRARRLVMLGIWLCVVDIAAALALVVWFGFVGHH